MAKVQEALNGLENAILKGGVIDPDCEAVLASMTRDIDTSETGIKLGSLVYRATAFRSFFDAKNFCFEFCDALYQKLVTNENDYSIFLAEALNYLRIYNAIASEIRAKKIEDFSFFGRVLGQQDALDLLLRVHRLPHLHKAMVSTNVIEGKIRAISGDADAERHFSAAASHPSRVFDWFQADRGAETFLSSQTVKLLELDGTRPERLVKKPQLLMLEEEIEADRVVLMSADARFCQIYMPYWLSIANYMKGDKVHFHIIITEPVQSALNLIASLSSLNSSLCALRSIVDNGQATNFSFSIAPPPEDCPGRYTYAASARFLYAKTILEKWKKPIIIQDMDFVVSHPLTPYLAKVPSNALCVKCNRFGITLDPWRRYTAGFVAVPYSLELMQSLQHMETYILAGLRARHSWFLDQNALAAFFEFARFNCPTVRQMTLYEVEGPNPLVQQDGVNSWMEDCQKQIRSLSLRR